MPECNWCGAALARGRYCSKQHRQTAFRLRKRSHIASLGAAPRDALRAAAHAALAAPGAFEIADPPYPGMAHYYRGQPTYAGEVDHVELCARLLAAKLTGFALCTSSKTLREVLPLLPEFPRTRVAGWFKPLSVSGRTRGAHSTWEPVLIVDGRKVEPGLRDWGEEPEALRTATARLGESKRGESLIGRKPLAWCAFVFDLLGMLPGDTLIDTFPGSGIVSKAWASLSPRTSPDAGTGRRAPLLPQLRQLSLEILVPQ